MTTAREVEAGAPPRRSDRGGIVAATSIAVVAAVAAALSAVRLVPSPQVDDHGTYASVAERLVAGDRLYTDVWDNKDPVFYYALALGRLASPLADYAIEILWVLIACAAAWSLSRTAGLGRAWSVLVGALTPVVLTGSAYVPGMTHLPGVALTLGVVASAARRRWVVAGALTALVVLTKIILAPVAVAALLTCLWHHRSWSGALRAAVAGLVALGVGLGGLAMRDELGGWVENIRANLVYADGDLFSSRYGGPVGHLLRAFPEASTRTGLVAAVAVVAVLAVAGVSAWQGRAPRPLDGTATELRAPSLLASLAVSTLAASALVLAATATWPHHGQTLGIPAVVALVLVGASLRSSRRGPDHGGVEGGRRARGPLTRVMIMSLTAYALGGALHPAYYVQAGRRAPDSLAALQQRSPASVALESLPQVRTYARAGSNDTTGHATGLRGLGLACPRFHQYSIEPAAILDATAACLPRADALIVDDSVRPEAGAPAWNAYVARVRALVASGYDCVRTPGSQVCVRHVG